jgi:putative tricarboxylic transport membrane protein
MADRDNGTGNSQGNGLSKSDTRDVRGTIGALIFIVIGAIGWWQIRNAPSPQAVMFPRTVIGLMVLFCLLVIVRNLLGRATPEARQPIGSIARQIGLLAAMVLATLAMPYIGFVIAALAAYIAIMAVAMYERWTPARRLLYPLSGVVVVLGFYYIFLHMFQVPLPEPAWFTLPF